MTFFERLIHRLRPTPRPPDPTTEPASSLPDPALPESRPASERFEAFVPEVETAEPLPDWLEDENLLRDEGVLFGLSESRAEEKVAVIRMYFQRQTARLEQEVEHYRERIGELNLFIEQKENRIVELGRKTEELQNRRPEGEHQLPRTVAGLVLSGAMCLGNYFLIEETMRPVFQESRLISIGVFLAGMFSLYGRTSMFHDTGSRVNVRRVLEEAGLPVAASVFIFIQALQTQPVSRAVGVFVFTLFLFLLAGKLLLGTLTLLRNDLRFRSQEKKLEKEREIKTEAWEKEMYQLTGEIDGLRVRKWQVLPHLNRAEAELHRIIARREMLISIFESEFNLARSLRDRLSDSQKRSIQDRGL
ncbi:hypothetical protein [Larkinella soli]|uniref:hypothetical protein n=1 Tax=Larkinella soli TaxID=1770527 RepID=UPI000FFC9BA9|nr:hypothetical protein [Larkinella soli]